MSQDEFLEIHWLKNMVLSFQGAQESIFFTISPCVSDYLLRFGQMFLTGFFLTKCPHLGEKIALNTKFNSYFIKGGINFVFHS